MVVICLGINALSNVCPLVLGNIRLHDASYAEYWNPMIKTFGWYMISKDSGNINMSHQMRQA